MSEAGPPRRGRGSLPDVVDNGGSAPYPRPQGWWHGAPHGVSPTSPRPPAVTLAVVLTWVTVVIVLLTAVLILVLLLSVGDELLDAFDIADHRHAWIVGIGLGVIGWCFLAGELARGVLRGRGWARRGLALSAGLAALVSLFTAPDVVPIITLVCSVTVVVLLFTPSSNAWFREMHGR
jgi:hypothetical protein